MTVALAFLAMLASVPLAGGRVARLGDVRFRSAWVAALAFGVQVVLLTIVAEGDRDLHRAAHIASYALAGYALACNLCLPYVWLIALGGALNLAAIVANGGIMPASPSALRSAGLEVKQGEFSNSDAVEDARLAFLGDVFALPAGVPGANVFSVGDVVMAVGALLALHALTGSRLAHGLRWVPARLGCRGRRRAGGDLPGDG